MASEVTSIDDVDTRPRVNHEASSDSTILTAPENGDHFDDSSDQLLETGCSQSKTCVPALGDQIFPSPESGTTRGPRTQS